MRREKPYLFDEADILGMQWRVAHVAVHVSTREQTAEERKTVSGEWLMRLSAVFSYL